MRLLPGLCVFAVLLTGARAAPPVPAPPRAGAVLDQAQMLDAAAEQAVEAAVRRLEAATGGQMAVLTVRSLEGTPIEEYALAVAEAWKIGRRKVDDGALLLVAAEERTIRIEIGYGWEGSVNDARVGDIIRSMGPFFREGRVGEGMIHAIGRIQAFITGQAPSDMPSPPVASEGPPGWFLIVFLLFMIVFGFAGRRRRGVFTTGGHTHGGFGGMGGFHGGGGSFGGGFRGGGGSFGGGGATGRW